MLPTKRASANVYLKDPVKPGKSIQSVSELVKRKNVSDKISDELTRKETTAEKDERGKKLPNSGETIETHNISDLDQSEAVYTNVPVFEIPKIVVTDASLTKHQTSVSQTDSERESDGRSERNNLSKQDSVPPCIRHFLNQEAEFHDTSRKHGNVGLHDNDTYHQPLKRQGAVIVEVVENGDLTSEASTIIGKSSPFDAKSDETKLTQLCAIRDELRNLAKAHASPSNIKHKTRHLHKSPQHVKDKTEHLTSRCNCGSLDNCNCGFRRSNTLNHPKNAASGPRVLTTDFVSKIAVGNTHQSPDSREFDAFEIYDDVLTRPQTIVSDDGLLDSSVKSLTEKFERIASSSRDSSPIRYKEGRQNSRDTSPIRHKENRQRSRNFSPVRNSEDKQSSNDNSPLRFKKEKQSLDTKSKHRHNKKIEDIGHTEEESIYEEYSFDVIPRAVKSSSSPRPIPRTKNKGVQVDGFWRENWNNRESF